MDSYYALFGSEKCKQYLKSNVTKNVIQESPHIEAEHLRIVFTNDCGECCGFSQNDTCKKTLYIGSSGYGKTNAIYQHMEQEFNADDAKPTVYVIFDSKGDFLKRFRCFNNIRTYVLSPINGDHNHVIWNLFAELAQADDVEIAAREVSKMLLNANNTTVGERQQFFVSAAINVLSVAILCTWYDQFSKDIFPSNARLVDFLSQTPEIILNKSYEYNLAHYINNTIMPANDGVYDGQTQGVMAEINNVKNDLLIGSFSEEGDFSIRENIKVGNKSSIIFIEYDVNSGESLSPIYTLMISQAIKQSLSRDNNSCKLTLFIDEWGLLNKIPEMEIAISFGREAGLNIIAAFQHIGQMRKIYGVDCCDGMLNGFQNLVIFNLNDFDSREFVKKRFGVIKKPTIYYHSLESRTESYQNENIIEDSDILRLDIGEALISTASHNLFKFKYRNIKG